MDSSAETIKIADQHYLGGDIQQAEQLYRLILQNQPDNASAFHMLGVIAHQRGDNHLAVDLLSKAVASNSQVAQYYNNLGVALKALDRFEEAMQAYEKALLLKPNYTDAYYNLGNALASLGHYAAAVEQYKQGLLFKPDDAYTYYNIGVAMQELGRHAEAVENFEQAIRMGHNSTRLGEAPGRSRTEVYRAMAASRQAQGRYNDAINTLRQALRLKPDCAFTHTDLGMLLLLKGDFLQGWKEYYWRLDGCEWTKHFSDTLHWDGSSFAGKRLLVRCEQGQGDNIHFVRYLPMVKARGGTVIFAIYKELYSLLKDFPGVDEAVNLSDESCSPVFDFYAPIMDLAGIFGTTLDTIPNQVPYIFADPHKVECWRKRLSGPGFKVGIVWSSSPGRGGKHLRDCNLIDFSVISKIKGVKLYSLQKGSAAEQIKQSTGNIPIVDIGGQFEDFSDTAAAIENLDLIISVDTSVLHLAGAMGKPTWALQCFTPDWRWMLDRDDSPWYPTMRLFRQQELGNWEDVFHRLAEQLQILRANKDLKIEDSRTIVHTENIVPVIIPSYKNRHQLEKCIACLENQTVDVEIFVRDNNNDNIYFTAAINEGIRKYIDQPCEFILILNQDMYLEPDAVEEMVKFMQSHPKCGIGAPLQLHRENPNFVICAGSYECFPFGKHQGGNLSEFTEDKQILWANGACMILRKEMIREIGLLDENFALLGSDSDYCFTARSRGWQVWSIAKARGIHEHGASGRRLGRDMEILKMSDVIHFGRKWLTGELYREMAYEGPNCTPEAVDSIMTRLRETKSELENQMSE